MRPPTALLNEFDNVDCQIASKCDPPFGVGPSGRTGIRLLI